MNSTITLNGFVNDDREDGTVGTYIKTDSRVVDNFINGVGCTVLVLENGNTITFYSE